MQFSTCHIPGITIITLKRHGDERGYFMETFRQSLFKENGIDASFVQDNRSRSGKHIIRGMHFQVHRPQGHLISVTRGKVFDVGVDLRQTSPTFGQWFGLVLDADEPTQVYLPPGIAHGFCTLDDINDIHYKCTDYYYADDEGGLNWQDPQIGIQWPVSSPQLNQRDAAFPMLNALSTEQLPHIKLAQ